MKFEDVQLMIEWHASFPVKSPASIKASEAVLAGRLIHIQDDRWTWEKRRPAHLRRTASLDGWEFVYQGVDELYMRPFNGEGSWISCHLLEFTRGRPSASQSGSCIECGASVSAGVVPLTTPSGRTFYAHYRTRCAHGGPDPEDAKIYLEFGDALRVLQGYFPEDAEFSSLLKTYFTAVGLSPEESGKLATGLREAVKRLLKIQ